MDRLYKMKGTVVYLDKDTRQRNAPQNEPLTNHKDSFSNAESTYRNEQRKNSPQEQNSTDIRPEFQQQIDKRQLGSRLGRSHMDHINTELNNAELGVVCKSSDNAKNILTIENTKDDNDFVKDIKLTSSDVFGGSDRSVSAWF